MCALQDTFADISLQCKALCGPHFTALRNIYSSVQQQKDNINKALYAASYMMLDMANTDKQLDLDLSQLQHQCALEADHLRLNELTDARRLAVVSVLQIANARFFHDVQSKRHQIHGSLELLQTGPLKGSPFKADGKLHARRMVLGPNAVASQHISDGIQYFI